MSVRSPSASTLNVEWSSYSGASVYLLDLRVVNSTSIAPVVVMQEARRTQRLIQGLRPGHVYHVTLKVFQFTSVVCTTMKEAITGKDSAVVVVFPQFKESDGLKMNTYKVKLSYFPLPHVSVPATSQITFSKAISSTSIRFEWSSVIGADSYILFIEKLFSFPPQKHNQTFTSLGGQVDGLAPSTTYNCYVYASNSAGRSAKSSTKTIMTCE